MNSTPIDRLYGEFQQLRDVLLESKEPSLLVTADETCRKTLLLAAASYFESRLTAAVLDLVRQSTADGHVLEHLVQNRVVERQYHTWFDWGAGNANTFFKMFGGNFQKAASEAVKNDGELSSSIKRFLELGGERNRLVHGNFASYPMEKTTDEIHGLYTAAMQFVDWVPQAMATFVTEGAVA